MGVSNLDIVKTAMSYKGKLSYVFGSDDITGGTGDCSSYTEHVFNVHGIDIGADTGSQYEKGVSVSKDDIKAGDLIFFKNTYDSGKKDGVSHVGIAVNSKEFIHLGNSGCNVQSLDSSYYKEHYLATKRIQDITYVDGEVNSSDTTVSNEDVDLVWWGDVVRVVVIVLVLLGGVALLSLSFMGSFKIPDVKKIVEKGVKESE